MLKNIAKIFSSHLVVKAIGLVNIIVILNFLSVSEFGVYSYLLLLLHLIGIIVDPFLSSYLVDFRTFDYKKYNFGVILFSVVLAPVIYYFTKHLVNDVTHKLFLFFFGTFVFSASLKSYLNVKEKYLIYGLVDVFRQVSILISTLVFFYLIDKRNYIELLELNYLTAFLVMVICMFVFIKITDTKFDISVTSLKKLTSGSLFLILYVAIIPFLAFVDSFFVEQFLSDKDLGLYSFSLKVYNISLMLVVPAFTVLNIKQIEIAKQQSYRLFLNKNKNKVVFYSSALFLIALLINWIATQYIFKAYEASFINTTILLGAAFFSYVSLPFSFLIAYRKYKYLFLLSIAAVSVNIVVNYFFIEDYGTIIAALATFLAQTILSLGAAVISFYTIEQKEQQ